MKKLIRIIAVASIVIACNAGTVFALSLNDFYSDQYATPVLKPENVVSGPSREESPESSITHVFNFFTDLVLYAAGGVAVLFLIFGGIMIATSIGDKERMESGKKIIRYAIIGLFVVILAYAIVTNVVNLLYRSTS
jgi:hypothetical protein